MSEIWFCADHHFGHRGVIKHCNRPFGTVEEMNEQLCQNWNSVVGSKDHVYILGDFCWSNHRHWTQRLKGKKTLIIGSHDRMSKLSADQFSEVVGSKNRPGILEKRIDDKHIVMSHYPLHSWGRSFRGSWLFFGHVHNRLPPKVQSLRIDVGVDCFDYKLVNWYTLKKIMEEREIKWREYWDAQKERIKT